MTHFSSVIVDFDGTLFDTRKAIAATLHETFVSQGIPPPARDLVDTLIGGGLTLEQTLHRLAPQVPPAKLDTWVAAYRRIYNSGAGIRASTPFPGSRETLARLHANGTPVVVASNKGEASVHDTLSHFGMRDFVQLVVAARDASATKPDPRSYFERIAPVLGAAACEKVLVAGDTDLDIRYARSIGATACWAAYGYGTPQECRALGPEIIADSPTSIADAACGAGPQ